MWSPWDEELNTAIAPSVASQSPALRVHTPAHVLVQKSPVDSCRGHW